MFLGYLIKVAVVVVSVLVSFSNWVDFLFVYLSPNFVSSRTEFDFIVVGGGSAGAVIAGRLAGSGHKVLLLEAGGPPPWRLTAGFIDTPIFGPLWQRTSLDWSYITEPQQHSCGALSKRASVWPRGRVLGGSGRLNNMVYLRGHKKDWKEWGISHSNMLHYFKKSENQHGNYMNDSMYHSRNGWLPVSDMPHTTTLSNAVLDAAEEMGYVVGDLNTMLNTGFMQVQTTSLNGNRFTADQAFLYGSKSPNLHLETNAVVDQVLFKANLEAEGVQFYQRGKLHKAKCKFGVVLSAGAVGSPKILLQSGIGPPDHLLDMKISVRVPLPSVGLNLQDHVSTGAGLTLLNSSLSVSLPNLLHPHSFLQYASKGTGPLTHGGCEATGLLYVGNSTSATGPPNIQLLVLPAGPSFDYGAYLRHNMGISNKVWSEYFSTESEIGVTILVVLLHPKSSGFIQLRSKDPFESPVIDPKYFSDPRDVETLVDGIYKVKDLLRTNAMSKLGARLNSKHMPGCEEYEFDSREYWRCYTRMLTLTVYHPIGTCRMGSPDNPSTVVDYSYRVLRTKKLYVADASVMPSLPSANINAAVTALAERAADILLSKVRNRYPKSQKTNYLHIITGLNSMCSCETSDTRIN